MSNRPTPEDRLMAELAWCAVQDRVPLHQRMAYMDALRGSLWAHRLLLGFTVAELGHTIVDALLRWAQRLLRGSAA